MNNLKDLSSARLLYIALGNLTIMAIQLFLVDLALSWHMPYLGELVVVLRMTVLSLVMTFTIQRRRSERLAYSLSELKARFA
jgi:hypothetical protein